MLFIKRNSLSDNYYRVRRQRYKCLRKLSPSLINSTRYSYIIYYDFFIPYPLTFLSVWQVYARSIFIWSIGLSIFMDRPAFSLLLMNIFVRIRPKIISNWLACFSIFYVFCFLFSYLFLITSFINFLNRCNIVSIRIRDMNLNIRACLSYSDIKRFSTFFLFLSSDLYLLYFAYICLTLYTFFSLFPPNIFYTFYAVAVCLINLSLIRIKVCFSQNRRYKHERKSKVEIIDGKREEDKKRGTS